MTEEKQLGSLRTATALKRYDEQALACQNATLHPEVAARVQQMNDMVKLLRLYLAASKDADERVKFTSAKAQQMKEKCEKLEKMINSG
jgi:cysteinyl-tRNA synthetase